MIQVGQRCDSSQGSRLQLCVAKVQAGCSRSVCRMATEPLLAGLWDGRSTWGGQGNPLLLSHAWCCQAVPADPLTLPFPLQ